MANPNPEPETGSHSEELSQGSTTLDREKSESNIGDASQAEPLDDATDEYPHGMHLAVIVASLMLCIFLVALDNTILATAIPKITDEFRGLDKVSWYGAAYFMTFGGFQSTWGKFFKYFPLKMYFLVAVAIFEVGSLICGVSQNSTTLIVGRAIAGVGGAGIATGAFTIIGFIAAPENRPRLLGFTGASYGIAAVLGPLLGGAFTDRATWRWCFYINLPVGGVAGVVVLLFFHTPKSAKPAQASPREKLLQMDFVGATLTIGLIVAYILALQYGGQTKPWNSSVVIGLLVGAFVLAVTAVIWEIFLGERAMIVPRLFKHRWLWATSIYQFFFAGAYFTVLYYLPLYFQSVHNTSAIGSGVRNLPFIIILTIAVILQGIVLLKIGYPTPLMVGGAALGAVSAGLLYTMDTHTSTGKWIGYQILCGFASGITFQTALGVVQVNVQPEDLSSATAVNFFFQMIGGSFCLSAAQSAFNNRMISALASTAPDVDPVIVLVTGATKIREAFTAAQVPGVVDAYVTGLQAVFAIAIGAFGVSTLLGCFVGWRKLSTPELKNMAGGAA